MAQGEHDHTEQRNQLREKWLRQGRTREQVAVAMGRKFHDRKRAAWRNAHGWKQQYVADLFNKKLGDPDNPITGSRISDYERWPISSQTKPTITTLGILADIYGTTILHLVDDHDYPKMNRKERAFLAALKKQLSAAGNTRHGGLPFSYADSMVPQQLPNVSPYFVGRSQELDKLTAQLDNTVAGSPIVITAIDGTAGIGKTALAVQWAQTHSDEFTDGQLYVNLRGFHPTGTPMTPHEAIRRFLDAFGVPVEKIPTSLDAQADLYRQIVKDKWLVIVLDNARDADQVRPLLPDSPSCMVLITSRQQLGSLTEKGATHITLGFLTTEEAHQLLTEILGTSRIQAEPDAVNELIHRCAHLPTALHIAAARIKTEPHTSLNVLVDQLRQQPQSLAALSTGDSIYFNIRAVFSWSYTALSPQAARLFRLLGLHPGSDISTLAAASLAGLPEHDTRELLTELLRASLLEEPTPERYQFHDLLSAYATEQVDHNEPEPQQQAARQRVLDYYLHTGFAAARHLDQHRPSITLPALQPGVICHQIAGYEQAMNWFTAEYANLLAAINHVAIYRFDTYAWKLPWTLVPFLYRSGNRDDHVAIQQTALAAAERLGDQAARAQAHGDLGNAQTQLAHHTDALANLQKALALYEKLGDHDGQADTHRALGWACEQQHQYIEAITHTEHALTLSRATGNCYGQARALNNIGWCYALLGQNQQTLTYCQQALDLNRELDEFVGEASTLDSLGYAYHQLGQYDQAITHYQQSIALYRELGYRYYEARGLTMLGEVHQTNGNIPAAREVCEHALMILDELDHPDADTVRTKLTSLDTDPNEPTTND